MTDLNTPPDERAAINTDRELWREREGDFYANSIHVTKEGGIGINVGGYVFVNPLAGWHALASRLNTPPDEMREARRALHCLHLAVDGPGIVEDVTAKVEAAFRALASRSAEPPKVASTEDTLVLEHAPGRVPRYRVEPPKVEPARPPLLEPDQLPAERSALFLHWWHEKGRKIVPSRPALGAEIGFEAGLRAEPPPSVHRPDPMPLITEFSNRQSYVMALCQWAGRQGYPTERTAESPEAADEDHFWDEDLSSFEIVEQYGTENELTAAITNAATRADALREAQHYAAMYGQDGPVAIYEVTRRITFPEPPPAASGSPLTSEPDDKTGTSA